MANIKNKFVIRDLAILLSSRVSSYLWIALITDILRIPYIFFPVYHTLDQPNTGVL